ncbi:UNVERIFIED_CONTAM: hypothetical protein Sindi_3023600, partial [Sesamum indicum]
MLSQNIKSTACRRVCEEDGRRSAEAKSTCLALLRPICSEQWQSCTICPFPSEISSSGRNSTVDISCYVPQKLGKFPLSPWYMMQ